MSRFAVVLLMVFAILTFCGSRTALGDDRVTWDEVAIWIYDDAALYDISGDYLYAVAWCESKGDVYAVGRSGEVGPFQWHPRGLWRYTPSGRAGVSPWDIRRNVQMAAWAFASGYGYHWSCS